MYSAKSTELITQLKAPIQSQFPRNPFWQAMLPRSRACSSRVLVTSVLLLIGLALAAPVWGAAIDVETTDATSTTECTLANAIATAKAGSDVGACVWDGDSEVALDEGIYETGGVLPFVIGAGDSISITGVGGSTGATIRRDAGDPANRFFNIDGTLDLSNVTLTGGNGWSGGSIMVSASGDLRLAGCHVLDNSATIGGAIYSLGALDVGSCTFESNAAVVGGGAIFLGGGTATVFGSTFTANSARLGGVIYSDSGATGALGFENSTFSANVASTSGGAIYQRSGYILAEMGTFKGNQAAYGRTLYREPAAQENLEVGKSAIDGLCHGGITSLGNNVVTNWSCRGSGDQQVTDLMLSNTLVDHGGLTKVHVPLADSPLLDGYTCTPNSRDQRDVFDRDDPLYAGDGTCDVGAYESICNAGQNVTSGVYGTLVYEGQTESTFGTVLNNGACASDALDFGGQTSGCSIQWSRYGGTLEFQNIWFMETSCLNDPANADLDCFEDPEACVRRCGFDVELDEDDEFAAGQFDNMRAGRDDFVFPGVAGTGTYTVGVDSSSNPNNSCEIGQGYRYVIQFPGAGDGEFDFWDPEIEDPNA